MSESFLGKIGDKVLEKVVDYTVAPIVDKVMDYAVAPIVDICSFNRNIEEVESQLKELQPITKGVQQWVDAEQVQLKVIAPSIQAWLKSANDVESEVDEIIKEKPEVQKGFLNLKRRRSLSRKAVKKAKFMVNLQKEGGKYIEPSCNPPPASTSTIPNEDSMAFESRSRNMEEIIKALEDDKINLIGIHGLPGVGKTTMAKEIRKRAIKDGLFVEVAWAVVSQTPNITNVQDCIANMLGLKQFGDNQSPEARADLLSKRLLQDNKKILVILDDVWEEFDLRDKGIPLGGANKNFKMLYTSRNRDLWHYQEITKIEIPLEPLSKDEAWKLFKKQVGDCVDAPDLQPIAKDIVDACKRLPLVLVLIGKALSKKKSGNLTRNIWEDMRYRLTCSSSTLVDKSLSSSLELSYRAVEDEEAKRLFLLCCLFEEDKSIYIEDLARYAWGFSLFDGIKGIRNARDRVVTLVADLKSRYLLLDDSYDRDVKHVKVHDLMRDMGISIASKCKGALASHDIVSEYPRKDAFEYALVSHGAVCEWPNKDKFQHYTSISVISEEITELPEELTCPNLEFLLLRCPISGKLSSHFFKGTGKLKVLELYGYAGIIPTLQPLTNLTMLSLEGLNRGIYDYEPVIHPIIGDLWNLEILSFHNSGIEELPVEIGKLVKLRLLDLTGTTRLRRIPPGVISGLVGLEELYILESNFDYWEGEGEKKGRNANLREFEFLFHLNTLEIRISNNVLIPKVPIFGELKKFKVVIGDYGLRKDNESEQKDEIAQFKLQLVARELEKYERGLLVRAWDWEITADHGGLDSLLRSSDYTSLRGVGCNDLARELLLQDRVAGLQQLKCLVVELCNTERLANTSATAVFPLLETLRLGENKDLREICHGPVPAGSFGQLTEINVYKCDSLRYLFPLQIVECLTQLRSLDIWHCAGMEEVIWKEQGEDVQIATDNRIKFTKLERLYLGGLSSLLGFCRGIGRIDFPQLKEICLSDLQKLESIVHGNSNLSSNSQPNDNSNLSSNSLFPQEVTFPSLEKLELHGLENVSNELPAFSLNELKELKLSRCESWRNVFYPSMAVVLVNLRTLTINNCSKMETIVDWKEKQDLEEKQEREMPKTLFPQLINLELINLPRLTRFSHFTDPIELPLLSKIDISGCRSMNAFFFGPASAPNFYFQGVSGNINHAIAFMQEEEQRREERRKEEEELRKECLGIEVDVYEDEEATFPCLKMTALQGFKNVSNELSAFSLYKPEAAPYLDFPTADKQDLSTPDPNSKGEKVSGHLQLQVHQHSDSTVSMSDRGSTSGGNAPEEGVLKEGNDYPIEDCLSHFSEEEELETSAEELLYISYKEMKSLPRDIFRLVSLQKLFLRNCAILMMELPPEIGELTNLEVLDLEGTEILCLPNEIAKLVKLTCLKVSFYGYANQTVIPKTVLSNLSRLKELIINVTPYGEWWDVEVEAIVDDLRNLKELTTLKLYLPTPELLKYVTSIFPGLAKYRFTVGRHEEHFISRLPRDVDEEFNNWEKLEKGLKFINGDCIPNEITKVLKNADAFFLQHHWTAQSLSEFGIENLNEVKFCLVMECNELQTIIDSEKLYRGADGRAESEYFADFDEAIVLGSLERLIVRYVKNMESIWKGSVGKRSLSHLKSLALHTCPNLTTLFTVDMLSNLINLEELIVEDCPKISSLVSFKDSGSESVPFLPSLKKISLLWLPGLVSISSGLEIALKLERMVIYYCPKLEKLSTAEVSSKKLKVIKGEKEWWDTLKWYESDVSAELEDHLARHFIPLRRDGDLIAQLTKD